MKQLSFRAFLSYAEKLHNQALGAANHDGAMPYLIGSVLTSWISLESFVNNMMQDYAALPEGIFSVHENGFLVEKQIQFNRSGNEAGTFSIGKNPEFRRIEDKVMFLIAKFGDGKLDKGGQLWQKFEKMKRKRNTLSHYHRGSDIELTSQDAQDAMQLAKELIELQKWLRLFEQQSPIYKWTQGGLRMVNRDAPKVSSYAASFNCGKAATYFSCGVSRSNFECGRCVLYQLR